MTINLKSPGLAIILSSPSGGGKSSLAKALIRIEHNLKLSISTTTRAPRSLEVADLDYYFKTTPQFHQLIEQDLLLEYTNTYGHYYGTLREPVQQALSQGTDMLLVLEWQGTKSIKSQIPSVITVFILPPSLDILQQRLQGRKESCQTIKFRMQQAPLQILTAKNYDYIVVNDDFEVVLSQIQVILAAERIKQSRLPKLSNFLSQIEH